MFLSRRSPVFFRTVPSLFNKTQLRTFIRKPLKVPNYEQVSDMPSKFCELNNETLSVLAIQGVHGAHKERLLREIMRVDNVSWENAHTKLKELNQANDSYRFLATLPYKVGFSTAIFFGFGSVPVILHRDTALWFNNQFVHEDLPEGGAEALDNCFKVGAWTWNYMEPVLGTASFVLLALQFSRAQMLNMDIHPYGAVVALWRARRLAKLYPQYTSSIVRDFAKSDSWSW
eukprot:c3539_g1_i1.p1 GENE.c3539_g1_i1~~c3539_g1_i1.p1  ORF type:complete len:230 (-),score=68.29 c3539_g1_i1:24-713(-)